MISYDALNACTTDEIIAALVAAEAALTEKETVLIRDAANYPVHACWSCGQAPKGKGHSPYCLRQKALNAIQELGD